MIKKLANEFVKNIRLMFRNWVSLSLLIIAPLILILLIGYAFSSDDITGLNIGIVSEVDVSSFAQSVEDYGKIYQYKTIDACVSDMAMEEVHICLEIEGISLEGGGKEITTGSVVYHYDNTRGALSVALINKIKEFFGLKAEEISIRSAQAIIEDIQNLVGFVQERKADIAELKNESANIRARLVERQQKLEEIRSDFLPAYNALKTVQAELHNSSSLVLNSTSELDTAIRQLNTALIPLRTVENMTNISLTDIDESVEALSNSTSSIVSDLNYTITLIDASIADIDEIKQMLDEEINMNKEMIEKIDISVVKIDELSVELDAKLAELSKLHPEMAERLVKPIIHSYETLLEDVKKIQSSFPQLAVIIIMFISLLFANIATLMEINDRAYFRNLIAPVDDIIYTAGLLITATAVIFVQVLVLFAVAQLRFNIPITEIFLPISFICILAVVFFILVGMFFAYLFRSVQTSILVTTFSLLVFFLFGNTLAFVESMPPIARFLSQYNPLTLSQFLIKQVQLFRTPLLSLAPEILLMLIYIIALMVIVFLLAKAKNRMR